MNSNEKDQQLHPNTEQPGTHRDPQPSPPQQPKIEIHQTPPEETSKRGCFGNMMMLFGLALVIVIGFLILNTLGVMGNELDQQTDLMQQQNDILTRIEQSLERLVDAVQNLGSKE